MRGFSKFYKQVYYLTNWGEGAVWLYFVTTVLFCYSGCTKLSGFLSAFQHGVAANQALIIIIYWVVLVPSLGLLIGAHPPKEIEAYLTMLNCYKHVFPFLAIYTDLFASRHPIGFKGVIVALVFIGVYIPWNLFIHFAYGITPYRTKFTSGDSKFPI